MFVLAGTPLSINQLHPYLADACLFAAGPLTAQPVSVTALPGKPVLGNALANTVAPGATTTVASFKLPGSSSPITPGASPVTVRDPASGIITGTIVLRANGTFTFTPAPGFVGAVPAITLTVASSSGQTRDTTLSVFVQPVMLDDNEFREVVAGSGAVSVNVLANSVLPARTTAAVTSFYIPGTNVAYPAGPTPVPVRDPISGVVAGTVYVLANGAAVFTPASGWTGQVPPITYTVACSDGQTSPGSLTINVKPGEQRPRRLNGSGFVYRTCMAYCPYLLD